MEVIIQRVLAREEEEARKSWVRRRSPTPETGMVRCSVRSSQHIEIIHMPALTKTPMMRCRGQGGAGGGTSDGGPQLGSAEESRSKEEEEAAAKEEQKRRRELQEKLKAMVRVTARRHVPRRAALLRTRPLCRRSFSLGCVLTSAMMRRQRMGGCSARTASRSLSLPDTRATPTNTEQSEQPDGATDYCSAQSDAALAGAGTRGCTMRCSAWVCR